jgi:hypothetical protein
MSFSAEMKDFLTAYKTGQSINASRTDQDYKEQQTASAKAKMDRDNDPDTLKMAHDQAQATLDSTRQRMGLSAAARGDASTRLKDSLQTSALSREIAAERLRQLKAAGQPTDTGTGLYPPGAINPGGGAAPVPGAAPVQGALPIGPSTLDDGTDAYADGGLVDDEESEDPSLPDEAEPTQGVLPTTAGVPAGAPTDVSARSRGVPRGLEGIISPQLVDDARREGMTWGIEKAGLHQSGAIKTPAQQRKAQQIAQGMGGLSDQEMQAAREAVDPQGKLTESQRNLAALGSVYQFWANKGEPDKARRVAFQMMQHYRGAATRYAAIAAKAAEGGNMDLATKAALKAYQNVPDGKDLEIAPNPDGGLMYTYTDEKGDTIAKGIATPQQLAASAMGLATGGFDKALMSAAGAQPDAGAVKTGGGDKALKPGDRAKEAENIGGEIDKLKAAWQTKNKDKPLDENQWNEVSNVAQHIYQQNPKATANEVAAAANEMLSMGDDPEKPKFKVKPGEDGKPNTVDFGGKLKVQLDDDQLNSILNSRAQRVKAATDKINSDMEESEKPGFVDKAATAASNIGGVLANDAKKFAGEVKGAIPDELAARGGSAVNAAGRAVNDVLKVATDPSINFGTMSTAFKDKTRAAAQAILDKLGPGTGGGTGALPTDTGDDYGRYTQ